jgi:Uma2 family endonuclease
MVATTELHRFTVEEFRSMARAGLLDPDARVELIDGLVVDMSPIGQEHAYLVNLITELYRRARTPAPDGPLVQTQQPVELGPGDQLVPDVSVVLGPLRRYRDHIPRADEVLEVVEVADTSLAKDAGEKLAAYQRAGVGVIVVVDVQGRRVRRWTRSSPSAHGAGAGITPAPWSYGEAVAVGREEWLPGATVDALFE